MTNKTENLGELRAYFFQNFYLQGIHAGIQSQHTTAEMFLKYQPVDSGYIPEGFEDNSDIEMLYEWATNHKTTIVVNGGAQASLQDIVTLFESSENKYPWASFHEAQWSLNGALTNVGIILPEKVFKYNKLVGLIDEEYLPKLTSWEFQLVEVLSTKSLMNQEGNKL